MDYMVTTPIHGVLRFRLQEDALKLFMSYEGEPACRLYQGASWGERKLLLWWPPRTQGTKTSCSAFRGSSCF